MCWQLRAGGVVGSDRSWTGAGWPAPEGSALLIAGGRGGSRWSKALGWWGEDAGQRLHLASGAGWSLRCPCWLHALGDWPGPPRGSCTCTQGAESQPLGLLQEGDFGHTLPFPPALGKLRLGLGGPWDHVTASSGRQQEGQAGRWHPWPVGSEGGQWGWGAGGS